MSENVDEAKFPDRIQNKSKNISRYHHRRTTSPGLCMAEVTRKKHTNAASTRIGS